MALLCEQQHPVFRVGRPANGVPTVTAFKTPKVRAVLPTFGLPAASVTAPGARYPSHMHSGSSGVLAIASP
jgi:hypothetical protein